MYVPPLTPSSTLTSRLWYREPLVPACIFFLLYLTGYYFLGERIPVNDGTGWDGSYYADLLRNLDTRVLQKQLNSYHLQRIFPLALVYTTFKGLHIEFTNHNIIAGMYVLNGIGYFISLWFWEKILQALKITGRHKILAFVLLFVTFPLLKQHVYYPVLTDMTAFTLSIVLLYAFIAEKPVLFLCLLLPGIFTWPSFFAFALPLFLFRKERMPEGNMQWGALLLTLALLAFALFSVWDMIYVRNILSTAMGTDVNMTLLPVSAGALVLYTGLVFFFYFRAVSPGHLGKVLFSAHTGKQLLYIGIVFLLISLLVNQYKNGDRDFTNLELCERFFLRGVTNPLLFLVASFVYFGSVMPLIIVFLKRFFKSIRDFGYGMYFYMLLALCLNFNSETRGLINALPVIVLLLVHSLRDREISRKELGIIVGINFLLSKCWFPIRASLDGDFFHFPAQRYFMQQGPYFSNEVYYYSLAGASLLLVFYFWIFRGKAVSTTPV